MKKYITTLFICFIAGNCMAQIVSACRSSYDNGYNNTPFATHYFPGPFTIPLNTNITGAIEIGGDVDYYKFYITTAGTINLSLTNLPANYNLRLVNSQGNTIVTSARNGTSAESIQFNAAANTYYFALVYPANNRTFSVSNCYTLRMNTGTASKLAALNTDVAVIYPNPAYDMLTLHADVEQGPLLVRVMDMRGSVVMKQFIRQSNSVLSVAQLSEGLYILDLTNATGTRIYKIIFKKQ